MRGLEGHTLQGGHGRSSKLIIGSPQGDAELTGNHLQKLEVEAPLEEVLSAAKTPQWWTARLHTSVRQIAKSLLENGLFK